MGAKKEEPKMKILYITDLHGDKPTYEATIALAKKHKVNIVIIHRQQLWEPKIQHPILFSITFAEDIHLRKWSGTDLIEMEPPALYALFVERMASKNYFLFCIL